MSQVILEKADGPLIPVQALQEAVTASALQAAPAPVRALAELHEF